MGRTVENVKVQNFIDIFRAGTGELNPENVRTVEVQGLVDTGATYLCLPPSAIAQLGLPFSHWRNVKTANGAVDRRIFKAADVTLLGRNEEMSVMENDEQTPPLIGYVVLEVLDFVVDPRSQKLIPNPEHGGKWMTDLY